jgi:hypothetical protein
MRTKRKLKDEMTGDPIVEVVAIKSNRMSSKQLRNLKEGQRGTKTGR